MSSDNGNKSAPEWLNLLNILVGLVTAVLSIVIIIKFNYDINTPALIVALILGLIGLARVVNGYFDKYLPKPIGQTNLVVGIYLLIISVLIIGLESQYSALAFFIATTGLLTISVVRVLIGRTDPRFTDVYSYVVMGAGITTAILAVIALLFELSEDPNSFVILGLGLLISGLTRTVSGIMRSQADD